MITREQYETLSKNYLDLKEKYAKLKEDAIIIPKNATNGDMIVNVLKTSIPNLIVKEVSINTTVIKAIGHDLNDNAIFNCTYKTDWWNAPYKRKEV